MAQEVIVVNSSKIYSGMVRLTANRSRMKLPDVPIPDGRVVLIKNNPNNPIGTIIYIDSEDITENSWPILPGEIIGYYTKNANAITVGVQTIAVGVTLLVNYTVEVD